LGEREFLVIRSVMEEKISREQKFLMLVQTAAIVKELSGEAEEIKKIRTANTDAHAVLGAAISVLEYIPKNMDISEAADNFIEYIYSKEALPKKVLWMIDSGL
jgi:hypothetical protein